MKQVYNLCSPGHNKFDEVYQMYVGTFIPLDNPDEAQLIPDKKTFSMSAECTYFTMDEKKNIDAVAIIEPTNVDYAIFGKKINQYRLFYCCHMNVLKESFHAFIDYFKAKYSHSQILAFVKDEKYCVPSDYMNVYLSNGFTIVNTCDGFTCLSLMIK